MNTPDDGPKVVGFVVGLKRAICRPAEPTADFDDAV
jgi:hypothetical protein